MKKSLLVLVAAGTLAVTSVAFAAPKALSSADLDTISAGAGIMDWFLPGTGSTSSNDGVEVEVKDIALADNNSNAAVGDDNWMGTFAADNTNSAVAVGEGNKATYIDQSHAGYAFAVGDNADLNLTYNEIDGDGDGSNYIIGNGNTAYSLYDDSYVDGYITDEGYGVIAREAHVTDSFNVKKVDLDVDVHIDDSFNVTTNTLEVSGLNASTGIVLAASLDDQYIGVNLNVTNATVNLAEGGEFDIEDDVATAETTLIQVVFNDSYLDNSDRNFVIED